jgi:hypothetical protein
MLWKFLNDESSLWKVVNGKNTSFWVVFSKFKSGINFGEYAKCLGHPTTKRDKNVDQVMKLFLKNRRMTVNKV